MGDEVNRFGGGCEGDNGEGIEDGGCSNENDSGKLGVTERFGFLLSRRGQFPLLSLFFAVVVAVASRNKLC